MKIGMKMLIAAILSLSMGVAFASPLLISEIAKPFPVVPEGPKADISVEIVYANFNIQEGTINETINADTPFNYTKTYSCVNVTYMVVLNITNLSDIEAKLSEVSFTAAENISVIPSALGGYSFERAGGPGANFGGVVKGVWLDGEWLNVTWISGTDYPFNLLRVVTPQHEVSASIPSLPPNASETGTWIEGVPIGEYYGDDTLERTQIYINGAWVDVTERIALDNTQPTVMATHTLANRLQNFGGLGYRNVGNTSIGPITELPSWKMYNGNGPTFKWINTSGFSNVWAPRQSRLIMLTSTLMNVYTEDTQRLSIDSAINSLKAGTINLYSSASSYITDWLVEGTYYNTVSTAAWLQKVNVEDTGNGYVYNNALTENQVFQFDDNGIEVFIATKEP